MAAPGGEGAWMPPVGLLVPVGGYSSRGHSTPGFGGRKEGRTGRLEYKSC